MCPASINVERGRGGILKPNTPYKLAWVPDGAPIPELMVVPLPTGPEKIDQHRYLELMSLRLADLLEAQDDPSAAAMQVAAAFDRAGLAPGDVRTHSPLAAAMDLIEDNLMFRTWLTLTDVLEEPEQAIPDPDALTVLKETNLVAYLDHVPAMSPEW
jgi:hypothetical protein